MLAAPRRPADLDRLLREFPLLRLVVLLYVAMLHLYARTEPCLARALQLLGTATGRAPVARGKLVPSGRRAVRGVRGASQSWLRRGCVVAAADRWVVFVLDWAADEAVEVVEEAEKAAAAMPRVLPPDERH